MLVPRGALLLVAEGEHVHLFRNRGKEDAPDLEAVSSEKLRPGDNRAADRGSLGASEVVAAVDPLLAAGTPLILVAPHRELDRLKAGLPSRARHRVHAEVPGAAGRFSNRDLARFLLQAAA